MSGLLLPGNAAASDVASGKTFSGGAGLGVVGTYTPPANSLRLGGGGFQNAGSSLTIAGFAGDTIVIATMTTTGFSVPTTAGQTWTTQKQSSSVYSGTTYYLAVYTCTLTASGAFTVTLSVSGQAAWMTTNVPWSSATGIATMYSTTSNLYTCTAVSVPSGRVGFGAIYSGTGASMPTYVPNVASPVFATTGGGLTSMSLLYNYGATASSVSFATFMNNGGGTQPLLAIVGALS